ncbi:MAG TPA: hypothetical protein PKA82_01260 [Pyrinomonadaceae bacterium]|nr:hypothetical protein [Pyrinomonadaceae bacterium]
MYKTTLFAVCFAILVFASVSLAQPPAASPTPKPANQKDVESIDAIMKAVYASISGDAGQKRDWDRFRSLFHKDARLIPTGKNATTGVFGGRAMTPDDYAKQSEPYFDKNAFYETELARHTDTYGNIVQVFSTYESRRAPSDKTPFMRGINSFQLLNDGTRWWVLTIYWQHETPDNPIPKQYLKSRN